MIIFIKSQIESTLKLDFNFNIAGLENNSASK